ncbi:DUF6191 domain-containing protein [Amycolatopsis arida]|uniref:DUF6191 domain-containing protein n=1 Tax=Amycolatopsis arida TaxID=587909 RepID=UPI0024437504|nr:DUF6191 domain-containing protein [Amycolatopsis arida]
MMREEDGQGAPPWHGVDLDRGILVPRPSTDARGHSGWCGSSGATADGCAGRGPRG